jgi:hypothetical protein
VREFWLVLDSQNEPNERSDVVIMVLPIIILVSFGVAGAALAARTTLNLVNKHGGVKQAFAHYRHSLRDATAAPRINLNRNEENYTGSEEEAKYFTGGFESEMNIDEACLILGLNEQYVASCLLISRSHSVETPRI